MDDLGCSDLEYLGGDIPTANINELATNGIRLNYHYAENVCSATRSALLSGRYAWKTSLDDIIGTFPPSKQSTNTSFKLISDVLSDNGYDTLFVGKWHIGSSTDDQLPYSRGFKQSLYFTQGVTNYHNHNSCINWKGVTSITNNRIISEGEEEEEIDPSITNLLTETLPNGWCRYDLWYNDHQSFIEYDQHQYVEDIFVDRIMVYLDEYVTNNHQKQQKEAFFIYWAMHTPHFPITIPPQITEECDYLIGKTRQTQCNMLYYGDLLIGQIIDDLKEKNIYKDTVIIFISDNGAQPALNKVPIDILGGTAGQPLPFRGAKSNIFEGGIRTPAFIHFGDSKLFNHYMNDISCDYNSLVYIADFYPMIADLSGVLVNQSIDGINLWRDIEKQCNHHHPNEHIVVDNDIKEREEIITFRLCPEFEEDELFCYRGYLRTKEYKLLINPNKMSWFQFDFLENWVNYDGEYYLIPNETYYRSYNEYDKQHYNQKLFYSKCYQEYLDDVDDLNNSINTEAYLLNNDTEIYLFKIMEDNIEACNIAEDNMDIVYQYIDRLEEEINLYHGSIQSVYLDKAAYVEMIDSYHCQYDTFFFTKWTDNDNITDSWNSILLSIIDKLDACSDN